MSLPSRRTVLRTGTAAGALAALPASTLLWTQPAVAGTPGPEQIHLQWGDDPSTQLTVSWATGAAVRRPRVRVGTARDGAGDAVRAQSRSYVDGLNKVETFTHHAKLRDLDPDTSYVYEVLHDGAAPVRGTFRTAPAPGRAAFRFTSFGDLGTGDNVFQKSSIHGAAAVRQVEQFDPLFHLLNGDLSYANNNPQLQPQCWNAFMNNMAGSAARRPWMPAPGNHEVEAGGGDLGYASYRTRFELPDNGTRDYCGNWYSFQVGSVLFASLDGNEIAVEDDASIDPATGQSIYISGYSEGAQLRWLERVLRRARQGCEVDWIVVNLHQFAMSSSASSHGGDMGIREKLLPLLDRYSVDLVLAGHDHDYERTHPVRGTEPGGLLTPAVADDELREIDATKGTVHLILGGGGTAGHDDKYLPADGSGVREATVRTQRLTFKADPDATEQAHWSAVIDPDTRFPYGVAVFDVDPGTLPGGRTTITVSYYHSVPATAAVPFPAPVLFDRFTLHRNRSDGWGSWGGWDGDDDQDRQ
ncbi:purple acid phosphatase family protein [Kitasatospora viridis]|uniref:Calcineurin-like phosphoesterase family protein n=1 Tax=Kitasatospora viridis TaxID=281105 RepID=A0A561SEE1_9ACTN|nr:metallophosphoesterase family protein [Kitasatospora viridis]TWF73232.1 calcineurin-like phosphoesterase family protein [Kitasatospora viridis]